MTKVDELQDLGPTHFRIRLDPKPDLTWAKQFEGHYNAVLSSDRVPMEVSGGVLSVHCHMTLLENYLPRVDELIEASNASTAQISAARDAERARLSAAEDLANREGQELLDRLKKL